MRGGLIVFCLVLALRGSVSFMILTEEAILSSAWRYESETGFLANLQFEKGGNIKFSTGSEQKWSLNGKILTFRDAAGTNLISFTNIYTDFFTKFQLTGLYLTSAVPAGSIYFLEQMV